MTPTHAWVALCLLLGMLGGGYLLGARHVDAAWAAKDAKRLLAERSAADAEFRRADKASAAYQAELLRQRIESEQLERAFDDLKRRHSILARRSVGGKAAAPSASASGDLGEPAPTERAATEAIQCLVLPAGDDPGLTLGAVWMWNSALHQRDTPAGACGLADTSEAACAADAGVSLTEAWDNQAANARLCAEDRARHQRLIDYIKERQ